LITKQLIEQIEGEATLFFDTKDGLVESSTTSFENFRGVENILKNKPLFDALVITPRVCGICGHAHLMATVRAIEDLYKNSSHKIDISDKAQKIREFTLIMEIVQNHLKWIYFTALPELFKLKNIDKNSTQLKGAYGSSIISKAISVFAGQWPHSSYMVAGGITCDPTYVDILQAKDYVDQFISFFEKESLGVDIDKFLAFESCKDFNNLDSDVSTIEKLLIELKMNEKGFAHDRFIILGEHSFTKPSKLIQTRKYAVNSKYVTTEDSYSPNSKSYAKNALYKDEYYESGVLSRMMSSKLSPIVKNMHRRYKDSAYTRSMARIFELVYLVKYSKTLLDSINIFEPSCVEVTNISKISGTGVGVVEAPRGPLIHRIDVENGVIKDYEIITPTQFNIGSSTKQKPTPAQKAMVGSTIAEAKFIFKTFDVCSVCTTH